VKRSHRALLLLTCLCLLVTSINGIVDLSIKLRQTFTASAISDYDERLTVKVRCSSGRPSFAWWLAWSTLKATCSWHEGLWRLAWRVGSQKVTTVENALTITVTGSNIESPVTVNYYIEAKKPDGTVLGKTIDVTGASCNVGGSISDSTGSVDIDQHLSSLGLNTTQDQTIDYYVWVKVTATGLISGETLTAEVGPIEFDSVFYDYGVEQTETYQVSKTGDDVTYNGRDDVVELEGRPRLGDINSYAYDLQIGLRFRGVTIPQGADISSAYLKLYTDDSAGDPVILIEGEDVGDASPFDTAGSNFTSRTRTAASVEWNPSTWGTGNWVQSPDIASIVSEITGRSDWASGNSMVFFLSWRDDEPDYQYEAWRRIVDRDSSALEAAKFTVTYLDWSASWSWYPLPLSIVSLPIGRQLFWGLVIGLVCFTAIVKLSGRRERR